MQSQTRWTDLNFIANQIHSSIEQCVTLFSPPSNILVVEAPLKPCHFQADGSHEENETCFQRNPRMPRGMMTLLLQQTSKHNKTPSVCDKSSCPPPSQQQHHALLILHHLTLQAARRDQEIERADSHWNNLKRNLKSSCSCSTRRSLLARSINGIIHSTTSVPNDEPDDDALPPSSKKRNGLLLNGATCNISITI
jgi:hypothetical protein